MLREIPDSEIINPKIYEEDDENAEETTINLFGQFLSGTIADQGFDGFGVSIGRGLAEFFQSVLSLLPEA